MNDAVVIYITPPADPSEAWRVKSDGRPEEVLASETAAVQAAAGFARMVESAGGEVVFKVRSPDGEWESFSL